jgi:hypothetical protein
VTGLLSSLLAKPEQQAPAPMPLQAPSFAARPELPGGFSPLAQTAAPQPQQETGVSQALGMLETLRGADPQSGASGGSEAGDGPQMPPIAESVAAGRKPIAESVMAQRAKGAFQISGPNPDRLQSSLTSFAKQVARIYGGSLVGKDGSTHSKYTTSGNVSQHYTGNATDIFQIDGKPATGDRLLRAGRAALIAAGMPRKEAMKATGGLYNVGSHQVIFLTNEGGNHYDHLHISAR